MSANIDLLYSILKTDYALNASEDKRQYCVISFSFLKISSSRRGAVSETELMMTYASTAVLSSLFNTVYR